MLTQWLECKAVFIGCISIYWWLHFEPLANVKCILCLIQEVQSSLCVGSLGHGLLASKACIHGGLQQKWYNSMHATPNQPASLPAQPSPAQPRAAQPNPTQQDENKPKAKPNQPPPKTPGAKDQNLRSNSWWFYFDPYLHLLLFLPSLSSGSG